MLAPMSSAGKRKTALAVKADGEPSLPILPPLLLFLPRRRHVDGALRGFIHDFGRKPTLGKRGTRHIRVHHEPPLLDPERHLLGQTFLAPIGVLLVVLHLRGHNALRREETELLRDPPPQLICHPRL